MEEVTDFSALLNLKKVITPVFTKVINYLGLTGLVIYGHYGIRFGEGGPLLSIRPNTHQEILI